VALPGGGAAQLDGVILPDPEEIPCVDSACAPGMVDMLAFIILYG
jgi:hypothetical protein